MLYVLAVICSVFFLVADQLTKSYFVSHFALAESKTVIEGVLNFTYVHNDGGAWGLMSGHTWLLLGLTALIMIVCVAMLMKNGFKSKTLFWAICLILSGGIGNMIDRIFRGGEVVDFIQVTFIDFPVFNLADCAVCIGAGLLMLYFVLDMVHERRLPKVQEAPTYYESDEQNETDTESAD